MKTPTQIPTTMEYFPYPTIYYAKIGVESNLITLAAPHQNNRYCPPEKVGDTELFRIGRLPDPKKLGGMPILKPDGILNPPT